MGSCETGPRAADGVRHGLDRLVLANDALVEPLLHLHQLLDFALDQPANRDARPAGDDLGNILAVYLFLEQPGVLRRRFLLLGLAQLLLELHQLAVLQLRCPVQVIRPLGLLDLDFRLVDLLAQLGHVLDRLPLTLPARTQRIPLLLQVGQLLFQLLQPLAGGLVFLLAQGLPLDFELHDATLDFVELDRQTVISMRSFDAASSIRSMALSGRKRSAM